jgi:hypothetical protein
LGVQPDIIPDNLPDNRSIETALEIMGQDLNNLQLKIDYLTSIVTRNIKSFELVPKIDAAQAFPDHPSYLIYMAQHPVTNTVMDIVANPSLFNSMNLF